jgi:hypothetical protein
VELVHEILGNELGHVHDVQGVAENGQVDIVADEIEIREDISAELHEDDLFIDVLLVDIEFFTFGAGPDAKTDESLLLDLLRGRWGVEEGDLFTLQLACEQEHAVARGVQERLQGLLVSRVSLHGGNLVFCGIKPQVLDSLLEDVIGRRYVGNFL